jgi:uncharacterized OB-fold protein
MTISDVDQKLITAAAAVLDRTEGLSSVHVDGERIKFQHCAHCGYVRYPAARFCPECLSDEARWVVDSGRGTIWSFAIYHRAFDPAFAAAVPYDVALVELESGPRLITNVLGTATSALRIGAEVLVRPYEVRPGKFLMYAEQSAQ